MLVKTVIFMTCGHELAYELAAQGEARLVISDIIWAGVGVGYRRPSDNI